MPNKEYDKIIQQIKEGLTGVSEHDIPYLDDMTSQYKDHPLAREILQEIGRMIVEARPDEVKAELERAAQSDIDRFAEMLESVDYCMYKKDYKKALEIIEPFIVDFEETTMFADDAVSEYHCFHEPMEELLYEYIYAPEKELRQIPIDLSSAYFVYGNLLFEMKRYDEAALRSSVR